VSARVGRIAFAFNDYDKPAARIRLFCMKKNFGREMALDRSLTGTKNVRMDFSLRAATPEARTNGWL